MSDRYASPPPARNGRNRNGDDRSYSDYRNSNGDYRNGRGSRSDYDDRYDRKRDRQTDDRRRSFADGPRYHHIQCARVHRDFVHSYSLTSHHFISVEQSIQCMISQYNNCTHLCGFGRCIHLSKKSYHQSQVSQKYVLEVNSTVIQRHQSRAQLLFLHSCMQISTLWLSLNVVFVLDVLFTKRSDALCSLCSKIKDT